MDRLLTKNQKKTLQLSLKMKTTESGNAVNRKLSSLGCLDGVDFLFFAFCCGFDMGGHVAVAVFPFQGRIWCGNAVHAGGIFRQSLASHAFIHHRQAVAFIIAAASGCHEHTVIPFSNSRTDHDTIFLNPYGLIYQRR
jgi:hypothetical protein